MANLFLIALGIVILGVIFSLFLIYRGKRKAKAIKHYERIRDRLTIREPEEEVSEESIEVATNVNFTSLFTGLITLAIVIAVGGTILSNFANLCDEQVVNVTSDIDLICGSLSEQTSFLTGLVGPIFMIAIAMIIFGVIARSLTASGLIGNSDFNSDVKRAEKAIKDYNQKKTNI